MAFQRVRRFLMALAGVALLAACGGGTVVSQFQPTRLVVFGDAFADLGLAGGGRYTVNDGSTNLWTLQLASRYGLALQPQGSGGTSYATGNARVLATTGATGQTTQPTVKEQVDAFLGADAPQEGDLIVLNAGIADIVGEVGVVGQLPADTRTHIQRAARDLGAQVRRLTDAGARHVVVVGPYDLGKSPWARQTSQTDLLKDYSIAFNTALQVSIEDLGEQVLYVDAALFFNLVVNGFTSYGLTNASDLACASTDAGLGIGTGAGEVNASLCTSGTLVPGIDPADYLFADRLYPTPVGHRLFGDYAYTRIRARW